MHAWSRLDWSQSNNISCKPLTCRVHHRRSSAVSDAGQRPSQRKTITGLDAQSTNRYREPHRGCLQLLLLLLLRSWEQSPQSFQRHWRYRRSYLRSWDRSSVRARRGADRLGVWRRGEEAGSTETPTRIIDERSTQLSHRPIGILCF